MALTPVYAYDFYIVGVVCYKSIDIRIDIVAARSLEIESNWYMKLEFIKCKTAVFDDRIGKTL